jgi:hypothetical protein
MSSLIPGTSESFLHFDTTLSNVVIFGTEQNVSESPAWFAQLYKKHELIGGHVIKLGGGNDDAAREALSAWPG